LPETSPEVIQQLLLFLPATHPAINEKKLNELLKSTHPGVQTEAVRTLREMKSGSVRETLLNLAMKPDENANLRAEAVIGLDSSLPKNIAPLLKLAKDKDETVSREALRTLTGAVLTDQQQTALKNMARTELTKSPLIERILTKQIKQKKPSQNQLAAWMKALSGPADPLSGQRLFFHPKGPGCFRCHQIDGRGQQVGPGLLRVQGGRIALNRERLVEAIINPSKDIDPGFIPLTIVTINGQTASGIYHKHNNKVRSIYDSKGKVLSFKIDDIEEMLPSKTSIMPNGLVDQMTIQEFRDLIAYLLPESNQTKSSN